MLLNVLSELGNFFKSGLESTNTKLPVSECDRLIPQFIINLNLLQSSILNPKLSSFAYLHEIFDLNITPLVTPGIRLLIHLKSTTQNIG